MLQQPLKNVSQSTITSGQTFLLAKKEYESSQQLPFVELISLPETAAHFLTKNANQLLVCIDSNGSIEFYDSQHKSWHTSPVSLYLPNGQQHFELALLGSMLYAFGGNNADKKATNLMWSRDLSDPSSQWTARTKMKQSRYWFSSVVLNDTIYALGGWDYLYFRICERYCSQLNEWLTVADMNNDRDGASAAVINGCIYVAGGGNEERILKVNERILNSVCKYCPETDTWREVAPMTTQRRDFPLTPFAGRLWAIGGMDGDLQPLSSCESYDPVTDTWREEAEMKEWRYRHAAIEFNGELYVVGGWKFNGKTKLMIKSFLTNKHLIKLIYILC